MASKATRAQISAVSALLSEAEPQIRAAFLAAIRQARGRVNIGALIHALEQRDMASAVEMLRLEKALLWPIEEASRTAFMAGGSSVSGVAPRGIQGRFSFNGRHPRAEALIAAHGADLVQVIEQDHTEAMRLVLTDAMETGRDPKETARDITGTINKVSGRREGGIIGLSSQQTDWVINARYDLHNLDDRYFTRALRDKRFDPRVRKAIREGRKLSQADVDKITGRYKDKMLAHRGAVIARNEAFTAQAAGRHEAYMQMLDDPDVVTVDVRWQHSPQLVPRRDHLAMNGKVVPIGQDFGMPDGIAMAYPHDPRGGAKHSVGCKCIAVYEPVFRRD